MESQNTPFPFSNNWGLLVSPSQDLWSWSCTPACCMTAGLSLSSCIAKKLIWDSLETLVWWFHFP
jgi:hypothetical protein